jgi:ribonuclease HI
MTKLCLLSSRPTTHDEIASAFPPEWKDHIRVVESAKYLGVLMGRAVTVNDVFADATRRIQERAAALEPMKQLYNTQSRVIIANFQLIPLVSYLSQFFCIGEDNCKELEDIISRWVIPGPRFTYDQLTARRQCAGIHQPLKDIFKVNIASILRHKPPSSPHDLTSPVLHQSMLLANHLHKATRMYHSLVGTDPPSDTSQKDLHRILLENDETPLQALANKLNPNNPEKKIGPKASFELATQICSYTSELPNNSPSALRFHSFELIHNALPTRAREAWRGQSQVCPLCNGDRETLAHLHTSCPVTRRAISQIHQNCHDKTKTSFLLTASPDDFIFRAPLPPENRLSLLCLSLAIWRTRRRYYDKPFDPSFSKTAAQGIVTAFTHLQLQRKPKAHKTKDKAKLRETFLSQLRTLPADALHVYTDGSAFGNPGPSGASFYATYPSLPHATPEYLSISLGQGTNNAAELHALTAALKHLYISPLRPEAKSVRLFIDNQYAIKTVQGDWNAKLNTDLIKEAKHHLQLLKSLIPTFLIWVPGHAGIPGNDIADWLAKRGARNISSREPPPHDILASLLLPAPDRKTLPSQPFEDLADEMSDDDPAPPTHITPGPPLPPLTPPAMPTSRGAPRRSPRSSVSTQSLLAPGIIFPRPT